MAQAPPGIGKTLATIFPLLKACGELHIDPLFFLVRCRSPANTKVNG
jgi:DNA excision repair protein ERCC-2